MGEGKLGGGEGRRGSLHMEGHQALCQELKVRPLSEVRVPHHRQLPKQGSGQLRLYGSTK